jgi:hypothetical protein
MPGGKDLLPMFEDITTATMAAVGFLFLTLKLMHRTMGGPSFLRKAVWAVGYALIKHRGVSDGLAPRETA